MVGAVIGLWQPSHSKSIPFTPGEYRIFALAMDAPAELPFPHAGEAFSLGAAVVWAFAVIMLRAAGDKLPPLALNVFKNALAFALLVVTLIALGKPLLPAVARNDALVLVLSGVLGLAVADTLFLAGLNRLGAGRAAIVDCLYSPFMFLCASAMLGEAIPPWTFAALWLVVLAVLVGAWEPGPTGEKKPAVSRGQLLLGILLGGGAMLVMSVGIVMARPVLQRTDLLWAVAVRLAAGALVPALVALCTARHRADLRRAFTPGKDWAITLPAAIVGTYLSMILWVGGMKYTGHAAVSAILNQTSTLFTLVLATLILRERLTVRRVIAILLGIAGALLATLPNVAR